MKNDGMHDMLSAWKEKLGTYKYVLLVILAGLVLLLWPQKERGSAAARDIPEYTPTSAEQLEHKLEEKLGNIRGVGAVSVILTVERNGETVFATDRYMDGEEREETLVILSEGSGKEAALPEVEMSPIYRGALVICEGGNDPAVKLQVTQAVAVLTGLGTDRITVCQGN